MDVVQGDCFVVGGVTLVALPTMGEGDCMVHAIMMATVKSYQDAYNAMDRNKMRNLAAQFRQQLVNSIRTNRNNVQESTVFAFRNGNEIIEMIGKCGVSLDDEFANLISIMISKNIFIFTLRPEGYSIAKTGTGVNYDLSIMILYKGGGESGHYEMLMDRDTGHGIFRSNKEPITTIISHIDDNKPTYYKSCVD